jgi:Htaa
MTRLTRSFRRRFRASLALATVALSAAALTGTAAAAPSSGEVTLTLKRGAESSLLRKGVKVTYSAKAGKTGATKRAARKGGNGVTQKVSLPVIDVDLLTATVRTDGGLSFALNDARVRTTGLRLEVGKNATAISGKLGKKRLVLFRAKGTPDIDASSVKLNGAELILTSDGVDALSEALGLEQLSGGRLGGAAIDARIDAATPVPTPPTPIDPGGLKPQGPADPYASVCSVPAGKAGGFGGPPGTAAAPAAAPGFDVSQDATEAAIEWGFKQDLRNYVINVPPGGTLPAVEGATAHPAGANMSVAGSFFEFASSEATYEAGNSPDRSDDKLVAEGTGAMLFCKPGHGFDVVFKNPTVTLDDANSRISADVGANLNGTWYPFQRTDIAELDLSGVAPTITEGGNEIAWEDIPATLTADGAAASGLGGFYSAGEALDPITVKTTLDRPLLTECTVAAGVGALPRPAVDFALAPLPVLSSPVVGDEGTINWGFRRGTRNTASSFVLKGGSTESYPGNMKGGASAPPTGGLGKFFRFPISSYQYEAKTASPTDDLLIATSDATIGICVPAAGNFGIVLSKPTLVIDGTSSRIVANAYSFAGPFMASPAGGWLGGRVDLVNLDQSTISSTAGSGTVSWGEVLPNEQPLNNGIAVTGGMQTEALKLTGSLAEGGGAGGFDPIAAQIVLPTP